MFLDKAIRDSFLAQTRVSKCSPHRRYLLLKRAETLSNMGLMYVLGQYLDYRKRCSISCKTISCILFINSPPPNLQNSTGYHRVLWLSACTATGLSSLSIKFNVHIIYNHKQSSGIVLDQTGGNDHNLWLRPTWQGV